MPEVVLTAAWISFGVVLLLSVSILVFYFPMIVRFPKTKTKELLVNSLILSISQFPLTILAVCGIFIGLFAILKLPLLVLCLASLISYYVYSCSEKIFEKVETIS
ncbi:hypothetical protein [Bacillus infantis]|uniref:hypothetical protein n=1 Tax=Bacillus infantis TaxID=324767 RepID=UPI00209CCE3E|nr:hypothetical protein [Bacillus infantis]MCP1160661.1 hypothetical protein [Bacillus infantis]